MMTEEMILNNRKSDALWHLEQGEKLLKKIRYTPIVGICGNMACNHLYQNHDKKGCLHKGCKCRDKYLGKVKPTLSDGEMKIMKAFNLKLDPLKVSDPGRLCVHCHRPRYSHPGPNLFCPVKGAVSSFQAKPIRKITRLNMTGAKTDIPAMLTGLAEKEDLYTKEAYREIHKKETVNHPSIDIYIAKLEHTIVLLNKIKVLHQDILCMKITNR